MNKSQVQKIIRNQLFFGVNEIRTNNANIDKKIFGRKTNNSRTLYAENNLDVNNDLYVRGNVDISSLLVHNNLLVNNDASFNNVLESNDLVINQSLKLNYNNNIIDISGTISQPLLPMYVIDSSGSSGNIIINLPLPEFNGQFLHIVCIAQGNNISINYTDVLGSTTESTISGASTVWKFIGIKNTTSTPPRNGWVAS